MILRALLLAVVALSLAASPVSAHELVGRYVSPVPVEVYLAAAAAAVALSFAIVSFRRTPTTRVERDRAVAMPRLAALGLRAVGLTAWIWIMAQAVIGGAYGTDVASLFLWTYGWVGVAVVSAFLFPVWWWLDPFATIHDLIWALARRVGIQPLRPAPYPPRLSQWPATAGMAVLVWMELALGLLGGPLMAAVLFAYTILTVACMTQYGRDTWRANGETFSVWFGTLGRLAPFSMDAAAGLRRHTLGARLLQGDWSLARVVLVALGVGSVLYDGLSQTTLWYELFGLADMPRETVLLFGFLLLLCGLILAVARFTGPAALGAGLVPIAAAYVLAHYLTLVLVDGQRLLLAVSDPLQQGWDWLGVALYEPVAWYPPVAIWAIQMAAVIGGHALGAWAGHRVASSQQPRAAPLAQLPLATLMVLLTVTTLWSLGQYVVQEPGPNQASLLLGARTW